MRIFFCLLILVFLSACTKYQHLGYVSHVNAKPSTPVSKVFVHAGASNVAFYGKVDLTNAQVASGQMLYPGYDGASFLAGIITHAAISSSLLEKQKKEIQRLAEEVWGPYRQVTEQINHQMLLESSLNVVATTGDQTTIGSTPQVTAELKNEVVAELLPLYFLSKNEETLSLVSTVKIFRAGNKQGKPLYQNQIEIVGDLIQAENFREFWLANDGEALRLQIQNQYNTALQLTLNDFLSAQPKAGQQENIKYQDGSTTEFVRGEVLERNDQRVVVRTLRGWLKVIPVERLVESSASK